MTAVCKKNLIINVTSPNPEVLRDALNANELFANYFDGYESTMRGLQIISTSFYWYAIPHDDLTVMIRHLQECREGHTFKVKVFRVGVAGNFNFD